MKKRIYKSLESKRRVIIFVSFVAVLILWILKTEHSLIRSIGAITLLATFYIIDHLSKVDFQKQHYFFIIAIAFLGFPLGDLYRIFPTFDKYMHFFMPLMFSSIAFYMVSKLKIEFKWKVVFTFFVVVGTIGLFEIGEYSLDVGFNYRLQGVYDYSNGEIKIVQSRIDDTMIDLVLGLCGTMTYLIFIIIYSTKYGEHSVGYRKTKH